MAVSPSDLHAIPLFEKITDAHLEALIAAFERLTLPAGEVLFEAGTAPTHLLILVSGEVTLRDGDAVRFRLHPLAPIGELGAVTGLKRATTAETTQPSEVWRISVATLRSFFEGHGDVAFPFYHNLLNIVADKIRRDRRRLEDVRTNLIRTQKGMKALLELVLASEETPLSREICAKLEDLIEKNRRWHYMVEPTRTLKSSVRLDDGALVPVCELSNGWMRLGPLPASAAAGAGGLNKGSDWSGVLVLPTGEIPVSGRVESADDQSALVKLDMLIDQYATELQEYLTRLQMLDFVV